MKVTQGKAKTNTPQIISALDVLMNMSVNITDTDRKAASTELDISTRTIARYEKEGTGNNLETAMKLIKFFRGRIAEREKEIAA